jgi:hypothetical protein
MKLPKLAPLAAGVLLTGLLVAAPAALAGNDHGRFMAPNVSATAFTETGVNSAFTQGASSTDGSGNTVFRDSVYTGSVSGNLIASGTFRTDLDFFTAAGASSSSVAGSFSMTDSSNTANTVGGFLRGTVDGSGNMTGTFVITHGAGSFANAFGQGTVSGALNNSNNTGAVTFSGQWAAVPGDHRGFDERPGHGFGDRNHVHTGSGGHGDGDNDRDER